jgi:ubiquinone/menaquinone biosynthesis C-methylase UbiE
MSADNEINTEKRNFDQEAANWDQVPGRVKVAQDIAHSMIREITLTTNMDVLDFGCGTGLLTLALQPFVRSITGMDSSQGMLDVFKTKIKEQHLSNVKANYLDLDKGDILEGSYQLIVSSMTLHHIKNISPLLKQFYSILLPSGQLAIADLDGFDRKDLHQMFIDAGFRDVKHHAAAQVEKLAEDSQIRLFAMFLMTGRK